MHIYDLFGYREYMQMLDQGYIRENVHPFLDLKIIGYTEKAQFDNEWNTVTAQCRGLIVNSKGKIIARPFDKFLNYGQNPNDKLLMDKAVIATDKMDGSLGILWSYGVFQGIATRGSFSSDQAVHATKVWNERYGFPVSTNLTYMFEIIYPGNRIVLDYGDMDDLVLLGVRDINDGSILLPNDVPTWKGPKTQTFPYETLREALAAPQRPNAEGLVVYFPDLDYRLKIKQDDYVALHKIVTGLTKRRIWEIVGEGKTLEDMCSLVPDEWHAWLKETYQELTMNFLSTRARVRKNFKEVMDSMPLDYTRKDFALKARTYEHSSLLFKILDGGNIGDDVWKLIKPAAE